ncbi:MAG TPA: YfiR family protein [Steroidobacteraceae bacterium]|jgi:hypothetical protein|nr:YfiR family protein [Steroidobacteraceae bacterium]
MPIRPRSSVRRVLLPSALRVPILLAMMAALALLWPLSRSWAALASPPPAGGPYPEDAVKAVFLYRFAGYVQWPASARSGEQFTIAVLGGDAVAEQLRRLLPDHPIQGEPAQVQTITRIQQLDGAQMLYIGPDYDGDLRALIAALSGRPVLVVTDQPGGLEDGGTVNFLLNGAHVRFEVSTESARRSGLTISSALLAVAERVKTGEVRPGSVCAPGMRNGRGRSCLVRIARQ